MTVRSRPTFASDWPAAHVTLQALGAERRDPVQWAFAEALARRIPQHKGRVRERLEHRWADVVVALQATCETPAPSPQPRNNTDEAPRPLRALVHEIETHSSDQAAPNTPPGAQPPSKELKTVRRYRDTWSRFSVDQLVSQDLAQAPKNAGPINSHMLTLRALEAMRDLAPEYLNRFVCYVDTLLFLEQQGVHLANPVKAVPAKRGRKKPASPAV